MEPDRDKLRAMPLKDKETFKEYAQRWYEIAAQVSPLLEEKEMTKLCLKMLSVFYYDQMVASTPSDFIKMVNMGMRLEEGVCEGRLKESGSSDSSRRYVNGFPKKKDHDANAISQEKHRRTLRNNQRHHHVESITTIINPTPVVQIAPSYQPYFQQCTHQQNQQNHVQRLAFFNT